MRMVDIILEKRAGYALTDEEICYFVENYTAGAIPDYQASAFTMAVCFQGMDERETVTLTRAMAASGDTLDLSSLGERSADKHSTGGVGDKTSLIVAPIVASLGGKIAKLSGRGLGHTGGTVDKLASIPGMQTTLPSDRFIAQAQAIGLALIGQTENLTPADKKLYALRDATGTVESIPLIVSSIMSKKLAAGAHNILLDVKVGNGAFMKTEKQARELARQMVAIGNACGRRTAALITNMDAPLGNCVGNALEVFEAVRVLTEKAKGDLWDVSKALASELSALVLGIPIDEAERRVECAVKSGAAFEKMKQWVAAQGGDTRVLNDPEKLLTATCRIDVTSAADGWVNEVNAYDIGVAAALLGAGRATKEDVIDPGAGIVLHKKTGAAVRRGERLLTLYTDRPQTVKQAQTIALKAYTVGATPPTPKPLIIDRIV